MGHMKMADVDRAQIYLATPHHFHPSEFVPELAKVLDHVPISCVRIALSTTDQNELARAADMLRETCHSRDVAIVIDDHFRMVQTHGLDGVHLTDGARHVRDARKELGQDAIVGAYCEDSRHTGMTAAEIGTDYISFGPISEVGELGDGSTAEFELFKWWSEMIEVPVVAEGGATLQSLDSIKDYIDFLTLGTEVWSSEKTPIEVLNTYIERLA